MEGRHWRKLVLGDKAVETNGADVLLPCGDKVGLKDTHSQEDGHHGSLGQ